jgi:hypothetical protein
MASSGGPKAISFAKVVEGREASVKVTEDGLIDVVETVKVVTNKDCNQANETLRNLKSNLFDKNVFVIRDGRRYGAPKDIIALIMVLPGKMAREIRCQFAAIIEEYFETHGLSLVPTVHEVVTKRQAEKEDALFEMEMAERKQRFVQGMLGCYSAICGKDGMDDRARLFFKDTILNVTSNSMQTYGAVHENTEKPLTISTIALELGKRLSTSDQQIIGRKVATMYKTKYGKEPSKHSQFVGGAVVSVNSYTHKDLDWIQSTIQDFIKPKAIQPCISFPVPGPVAD